MESLLVKLCRSDQLPYDAISGGYAREWAAYKHALRRVEDLAGRERGWTGSCATSSTCSHCESWLD